MIIEKIVAKGLNGQHQINMGRGNGVIEFSDHDNLNVDIYEGGRELRLKVELVSSYSDVRTMSYDIPLSQFNEHYNSSLLGDVLYVADGVVSALGIPVAKAENIWINNRTGANNRSLWKVSHELSEGLKDVGCKVKPSTLHKGIPKGIKYASRGMNVLSGVFIAVDMKLEQNFRASHIYSGTILAISCIPTVGWMFGGVCFLSDITVQLISGKSIGEHIDDFFNGGVILEFGEQVSKPNIDDFIYNFNFGISDRLQMEDYVMPQDNTRVYKPDYFHR